MSGMAMFGLKNNGKKSCIMSFNGRRGSKSILTQIFSHRAAEASEKYV